ncbi:hypothetical protein C0991_009086, partial [Blastosporella zonata]
EHSSSQHKALFKEIQLRDGSKSDTLQLLLDIKVRWGSTYVMLNQAKHLRQHVDTFLHELRRKELNRDKRAKLDALKLTDKEWDTPIKHSKHSHQHEHQLSLMQFLPSKHYIKHGAAVAQKQSIFLSSSQSQLQWRR